MSAFYGKNEINPIFGIIKKNINVIVFRDLHGSDVDFLEKLRDKSLKVIQDKYDVPANQLR